MSEEQIEAAKEVAKYIVDGDGERDNYEEHIGEGYDPRDHVYYQAHVVLGCSSEFDEDVEDYEKDEAFENELHPPQSSLDAE